MVEADAITGGDVKVQSTPTWLRKWRVYECVASTNETITTDGLGALVAAVGIRKDTGAAITCTVATTVVTITSTLTDIPVVVLVSGASGP